VPLHKPQRTIQKLMRYGMDEYISYALIYVNGDPETYKVAMERSDKESWKQGMMEEMESLRKNKT